MGRVRVNCHDLFLLQFWWPIPMSMKMNPANFGQKFLRWGLAVGLTSAGGGFPKNAAFLLSMVPRMCVVRAICIEETKVVMKGHFGVLFGALLPN